MKSLLILPAAALTAITLLAPVVARAQAPTPTVTYGTISALPRQSLATPGPAAATSPSPGNAHDAASNVPLPGQQSSGPTLEKNVPLIPENIPSGAKSARHSGKSAPAASPKVFATFATEKDIRGRVRLREAENRALNEPAIQADWAAAHRVPTDPERRKLLAVYYNHLFDRMIQLDPSIKERANLRRIAALARMKYTRLGDPDIADNPFVQGVPASTGPNPPASETPGSETPSSGALSQ
jgi:hypothetical protein